jgi:hypothetical protein
MVGENMSDHGTVLRALADRTDWQGDDGVRDAVYEALDRIDPPAEEESADQAPAKPARSR